MAQSRPQQERTYDGVVRLPRPSSRPQREEPQDRADATIADVSEDEIESFLEAAEKAELELPPYYRDTLLPEDALVVVSLREVEIGNIGGAKKWFAHFEIVECPDLEPDHAADARGRTILRSYNPPGHKWLAHNHELYLDWKAVTGRPLKTVPKRSPRAILSAFLKDVQVRATTRVVSRTMDHKARKWISTPEEDWYSVIDRIVGLEAGCPRVLQQRKNPRK